MKSTQCGWRSLAVAGLALLGIATVVSAADKPVQETAGQNQNMLPVGSATGDPDLRGPDTGWVDPSFAPPTQNLHPPRKDACIAYLDAKKFDADNPGLANFENYDSTVPGHIGNFTAFGCSNWATSGTTACARSTCWNTADIINGIEAREFPPSRGAGGIVEFGNGFQGSSSAGAAANFFVDTWGVWFNDPIRVSLPACPDNSSKPTAFRSGSVVSFFGAGQTTNHFTLYDGREKTFPGTNSPAGDFFGACCDTPIATINLVSTAGQAEGYDEVSFGEKTTCPLPVAPVSLDDLHIGQEILAKAIEAIEAKIDTNGCPK